MKKSRDGPTLRVLRVWQEDWHARKGGLTDMGPFESLGKILTVRGSDTAQEKFVAARDWLFGQEYVQECEDVSDTGTYCGEFVNDSATMCGWPGVTRVEIEVSGEAVDMQVSGHYQAPNPITLDDLKHN
jgi:hypothetical protein